MSVLSIWWKVKDLRGNEKLLVREVMMCLLLGCCRVVWFIECDLSGMFVMY